VQLSLNPSFRTEQFLGDTAMPLTFIDLFSGAGGLGLGFEMAGFEQILALEEDKWACETHRHNFPNVHVIESDIKAISKKSIRGLVKKKVDVIIGGPPCQGFSHANIKNKDPKDPRNSLFLDFLNWVDALQPKMFLIENVPALLKTKTNNGLNVIDVILNEITNAGYTPSYQVLDAKNYGVPQSRPRLFIVGVKHSKEPSKKFIFPNPTHGDITTDDLFSSNLDPIVTLWDALSDLPQETHEEFSPLSSYVCQPRNHFQKLMRSNANGKLTNAEPMRHTKRIIERFKSIGIGQSEQHVQIEHSPKKRGNPNSLSEKKYSQNGRRQDPNRACNAVVASSHSNFIHPYLHRNFTVRELLRIQSFPDNFELKGKRAVLSKKLSIKKGLLDEIFLDQRMQVGNAVPPLLAKAMAEEIKTTLTCGKDNVVESA
jgi:DNA (cytosine-5)-methyltransferase 1